MTIPSAIISMVGCTGASRGRSAWRRRPERRAPQRSEGCRKHACDYMPSAGEEGTPPPPRPWYAASPQLERHIPQLFAAGKHSEARKKLLRFADVDAPVTQFYLGVATGALEGEAAACDFYEKALAALPTLHAARTNLIRSLMRRRAPSDLPRSLQLATEAVQLQPGEAEPRYALGVILMQLGDNAAAARAYEECLALRPGHTGALVNSLHALGLLPADESVRRRVAEVARLGVSAGMWLHPMQRPPHLIKHLTSLPWHNPRDFPMVALLERHFSQIKAEMLGVRRAHFSAVGGRSVHDHTLVAKGEWREFCLFGNSRKYEQNCALCPVTTWVMEQIPEATSLAAVGGGETLFSTLRSGTHLRPHCGSTNARLTCHLGLLVPDGCKIRAGSEWRTWSEGECIVFDDSWEHEVVHEGVSDRVVLLINFWHPEVKPHERSITPDLGYEAI